MFKIGKEISFFLDFAPGYSCAPIVGTVLPDGPKLHRTQKPSPRGEGGKTGASEPVLTDEGIKSHDSTRENTEDPRPSSTTADAAVPLPPGGKVFKETDCRRWDRRFRWKQTREFLVFYIFFSEIPIDFFLSIVYDMIAKNGVPKKTSTTINFMKEVINYGTDRSEQVWHYRCH